MMFPWQAQWAHLASIWFGYPKSQLPSLLGRWELPDIFVGTNIASSIKSSTLAYHAMLFFCCHIIPKSCIRNYCHRYASSSIIDILLRSIIIYHMTVYYHISSSYITKFISKYHLQLQHVAKIFPPIEVQ